MKTRLSIFAAWAVIMLTASCTSDEVETPVIIPDSGQVYTYKMNLNVDPVPSDLQSDGNTRATTTTWADGSKLDFQFTTSSSVITGTATYSSANDEWTLATNRQLSTTSTARECSALYLRPDTNGDTPSFLTPGYSGSSTYTCTTVGGERVVSVNALTLDPATWRLRFKGTKGQTFSFFSKQVHDYSNKAMTDSLRLTIGSNGYSPYIYATFATGSNDSINVRTDNLYSRPMTAMKLGGSTTLAIPTSSTYEANGWKIIKEVLPPVEREAVDLGLPSGMLWANMNVGANRPEEAGLYFAWGETVGYSADISDGHSFNFENYKWFNGTFITKYCTDSNYGLVDGKTVLDLSDDAAYVNWGKDWRMPTYEEIGELLNNTKREWTTMNGVKGMCFTSNNNTNYIFLPAVGLRFYLELNGAGSTGRYWSSSYRENQPQDLALTFEYDESGVWFGNRTRSGGYSIRPVRLKPTTTISTQNIYIEADADSKEITVTSNEKWTAIVVEGATWCSVTPTSGTNSGKVKVKVEANTNEKSRTARITVTGNSSGMSNTITVTQKGMQTPPDAGDALTITANGVSFKMIRVEGGTFRMGTDQGDEKSPHDVTLSNDYYVAETEVTQALWKAVMKQTKNWNSTNGVGDQYPAYNISWNDCETFITELNKLTGREFRLPTEAEWDFAARGGNKSKGYTYSGSNTCDEVAWYDGNSSNLGTTHPDYGSHPVKSKKPNELSLYDMSGNVKEWCSDWYADKYNNGYSFAQTDPKGPNSGTSRVLRGGSWAAGISFCRISARDKSSASSAHFGNGLRLVLTASGSSGGQEDMGNAPAGAVAVDLGLPSGTKWANMNVGAQKPEDYGLFFAWGETKGYTSDTSDGHLFNLASYKWCNGSSTTMTKYCTGSNYGTVDNKTVLDLEDDAARVNWGGKWRMPTVTEIREFLDNTTSEWTTQNGVNGRKFTSKSNGNSVFLPAAGGRLNGELYDAGSYGHYWSSTLDESYPRSAYNLVSGSGSASWYSLNRFYGHAVRPVRSN